MCIFIKIFRLNDFLRQRNKTNNFVKLYETLFFFLFIFFYFPHPIIIISMLMIIDKWFRLFVIVINVWWSNRMIENWLRFNCSLENVNVW